MGLRRRHGRNLRAAVSLLLLFAAAAVISGGSIGGVVREEKSGANRRELFGPGSSPPTCRSRCGKCFPCRPIHVAIQPGRSFTLEYYPVAWRCQCGKKLFMP